MKSFKWQLALACAAVATFAVSAMAASGVVSRSAASPTPAPNPPFPSRCGLNLILVLDESYSIVSPKD